MCTSVFFICVCVLSSHEQPAKINRKILSQYLNQIPPHHFAAIKYNLSLCKAKCSVSILGTVHKTSAQTTYIN